MDEGLAFPAARAHALGRIGHSVFFALFCVELENSGDADADADEADGLCLSPRARGVGFRLTRPE